MKIEETNKNLEEKEQKSTSKLDLELIKSRQKFIKDEIDNVENLKKEISNKSAKLKEDLLKLVKEVSDKNDITINNYEKELKQDIETLNLEQKASSMKEILEKAKKAETVLNKKTIPFTVHGDINKISSDITKILEDNFKAEKVSNIQSVSKSQLQIKLNTEFSPLFTFFGIEPSDNFLKDYIKLYKYSKEEINFTEHILKYIFDYYDKDGNGTIDKIELKCLIDDFFGSIAPRSIIKMNELSEELKDKLQKTCRFLGKEKTTEALEKYEEEIKKETSPNNVIPKNIESIDETFKKIDTDQSGTIDFNEFKIYFTQQIKHMEDEFKSIDKESRAKLKSFISDIYILSGETFDDSDFDNDFEESDDDDESYVGSEESDYDYYK
eukprot:gene4828-8414_t